jgi:glucose-1-phosphate adenylyltransferase
MVSKKWIAMLLAGGQGSRLRELTSGLAKPAVPFGGKYRIIDFPLSNCTHSGIDTVGVLTQYQPHLLNDYVGNGKVWDLDYDFGGVSVLPPYKGKDGGQWYKGTANAIYQNIQYIDKYNPENVLILSGDHIYKMDYRKMLEFHIEKQAQATIAVIEVPWQEASRFGIMNTNENQKVIEFDEKPKFPKSNLASMGIYLFNWKVLRKYLIEDEQDATSSNDFGQNIIPKMLEDEKNLFAYNFNGYWKDVGTVESLWEAHMDLLHVNPAFDLDDQDWKILARNPNQPPHYIAQEAIIKQSRANEGCMIYGTVEHSVLSYNVHVGRNSTIKDSVIMPNVRIGENVHIERAIVASNCVIEDGVFIGNQDPTSEITLIGENKIITARDYKKITNI